MFYSVLCSIWYFVNSIVMFFNGSIGLVSFVFMIGFVCPLNRLHSNDTYSYSILKIPNLNIRL